MTDAKATSPLSCVACQAIDMQDGDGDGLLFTQSKFHVRDENHLWGSFQKAQDVAADKVTAFAGSLTFVYIHSVWFGIWVAVNVGALGAAVKFDPFPFGLLTMIVSLEAIFLATFVMVSQNRQAERSELRAQLDFETNLRAEIWSIHIGAALGIDHEHVEDIVLQAIAATSSGPAAAPGPPLAG
jgi:uncharacterized membrane protein